MSDVERSLLIFMLMSVVTSNAGGGGERVLWAAIACMQREQNELVCVIYTGDVGVKKQDMVNKAKVGITLL